jgi:cyclophilin family peptidyl-prolyl cis-trans isomerase
VTSTGVRGGPVGRTTAIVGLVAVAAIVIVGVALIVSRPSGAGQAAASSHAATVAPSAVGSAAAASTSPAAGSAAAIAGCPTSPPPALGAGKSFGATIETAKGTFKIRVEADLGPLAAGNFLALASCGFYDGLVFHRIVPGFVIQGGDPTGSGSGGPGYEFPDDPVTVPYTRGVVAMANSGKDTNGSQFFIVLKDSGLSPDYSVFGRVTSGMEAVDAIAAAADAEKPTNPIAMDKVTVSDQ